MKFGSYFSGGGGVDLGATAAGFTAVFAVEGDPGNWEQSMLIADAYERNIGAHVVRQPVQEVDPANLPWVHWFHASPVCKNASVAKANSGEDDVDIITARATAAYIAHHRPTAVTIENVWGYRKFEAWHIIAQCLTANGYQFRVDKINMADFGVPQTRERMIVTAVRGQRLGPLPATHTQTPLPAMGFIQPLPRWVSWYEAIEDIVDMLPLSHKRQGTPCPSDPHGRECRDSEYCRGHFADWQLERLPDDFENTLLEKDKGSYSIAHRGAKEPAQTVTTSDGGRRRAMLVNEASSMDTAVADEPATTVTASDMRRPSTIPRAMLESVLWQCHNGHMFYAEGKAHVCEFCNSDDVGVPLAILVNEASSMDTAVADEPAKTQVASPRNLNQRALLLSGHSTERGGVREMANPAQTQLASEASLHQRALLVSPNGRRGELPLADADRPAHTVTANSNQTQIRAAILNGTPNDNGETVTLRTDGEPVYTQTATMHKRPQRALLVPPGNASSFYTRGDEEPARTVTVANGQTPRALLVSGTNSNGLTVREGDDSAPTVTASLHSKTSMPRMWQEYGRVVVMTPRAIARFQSFPDWYVLPERAADACALIGNSVPPLFAQRVGERLMAVLKTHVSG